jgi:hypothetical protein
MIVTLLWKCNITHCHTTGTVTLLWKRHQGLIYHNIYIAYDIRQNVLQHMNCCARRGNVCFYCCNNNCHITMETPQTHCYAAGTVTLLWQCYKVHRSCYQGKPNMSQYLYLISRTNILYGGPFLRHYIRFNLGNVNETSKPPSYRTS